MLKRDDKPPWLTGNLPERKWMRTWVNEQLDAEEENFCAELRAALPTLVRYLNGRIDKQKNDGERRERILKNTRAWLNDLVLQEARRGNLEPLRKQFAKVDSRYVRYINLPPLKRGEHFEKKLPEPLDPQLRLQEAVAEVRLIRAIWKKHYGKINRPKGQLTAEQIAARRWGLTANEVRNKRLSRQRRKHG